MVERGGNHGSQIGSTLVEREVGREAPPPLQSACKSLPPVEKGRGSSLPSMVGCGYLAGPSCVLRLEMGGGA